MAKLKTQNLSERVNSRSFCVFKIQLGGIELRDKTAIFFISGEASFENNMSNDREIKSGSVLPPYSRFYYLMVNFLPKKFLPFFCLMALMNAFACTTAVIRSKQMYYVLLVQI